MKRKILSTIMIGITLILMVSCQSGGSTLANKNYEDFQHIDHWDDVNTFPDEETILYYYSPYCEICQAIQDQATEYLVILESNGVPIYMVHEGFIYEQGTPPLEIIETPSILIYRNQRYVEKVSGSKPILNYLENKANPS
jgi:hypothetical protein